MVTAFALNRPELLKTAMVDRMHQPYRSPVCPLLPLLLPLTGRPGVFGVALSGAGPSVLLVVDIEHLEEVRQAVLNLAPGTELITATTSKETEIRLLR